MRFDATILNGDTNQIYWTILNGSSRIFLAMTDLQWLDTPIQKTAINWRAESPLPKPMRKQNHGSM